MAMINTTKTFVIFLTLCTIINLRYVSSSSSCLPNTSSIYNVINDVNKSSIISEFPVITNFQIAKANSSYYRIDFKANKDLKQLPKLTHLIFESKSNNAKEFCIQHKRSMISDNSLPTNKNFLIPVDTTEIRLILAQKGIANDTKNVPYFIMADKKYINTSYINITNNKVFWTKSCEDCTISYTCRNCDQTPNITEQGTLQINSSLTSFTLANITTRSCFIYLYKQNKTSKTTYMINYGTFKKIDFKYQINENEMPEIKFVAINKIALDFSNSTIRAPRELKYKVHLTCLDKWCTKKEGYKRLYKYSTKSNHTELTFEEMHPFTRYNIFINSKVLDCDEFNDNLQNFYKVIKSPAGIPGIIRNFTHFYTNASHLWIRFLPPYPPTGIISDYKILSLFSNNSINYKIRINETRRCHKEWEEFICLIIKSIQKNGDFYIQAKNKDVTEFGPKFNFSVDTTNFIFKRSTFTINVNLSKTKLDLSWLPPYLQSGPFTVNFTKPESASKVTSINDYLLTNKTYHESVDIHNSQSVFHIRFEALNEYEKVEQNLSIETKKLDETFLWIKICNEEIVQCTLNIEIPNNINQSTIYFVIDNNMKNRSEYAKENLLKKVELGPNKYNFTIRPNNFLEINIDHLNATNFLFVFYKLNGKQEYKKCNIIYNETQTIIMPSNVEKKETTYLWIIITVVIGFVIIFSVLGFLFYRYKKKQANSFKNYENNNLSVQLSKLLDKDDNNFSLNAIKVENFENYVQKVLENDSKALRDEYDTIPKNFVEKKKTIGSAVGNKSKNRFKNILPYDDVIVNLSNGNYINASFANGFQTPNAYIATQAPLKTTINDLWQMVWEQKVTTIIMLTTLEENNKIKSEKYWPQWNQSEYYGDIYVANLKEKIFSDYNLNSLKVVFNNETRIVEHFQYLTWPDHRVPLYQDGFVAFMREVITKDPPIVVHCNAGCGRTGTFIMCHIILQMAESIKIIDFLKVLNQLRESRVNMVNNSEQYIFAHLVVYQYLFENNFAFPVTSSFSSDIEIIATKTIHSLQEHLNKFLDHYQKRFPKDRLSISEEDTAKNRFSNILPLNHARMFLIPNSRFLSNYINAISVDCYRASKKFIVTQQPLVNTIEDFWRLVKDNEIHTIVSLNEIVHNEDTPVFWPDNNSTMTISTSLGEAQNVLMINEGRFEMNKIKVFNDYVEIYQLKDWQKNTNLPKSTNDVLVLWKEIWNQTTNSRIIVTCYDGATASGLFVALSYLLEQINLEQICDVYSAIKTVKQSRLEFVSNEEQILFMYKAAKDYIADFSEYGNFKSF